MMIRAKLGTGPALNYRVRHKQKPPKVGQTIVIYDDRMRVNVRVVAITPLIEGPLYTLERA